jgi:hypothetical protein
VHGEETFLFRKDLLQEVFVYADGGRYVQLTNNEV